MAAPISMAYAVTPLQVPAPAGLAPGPAALAFSAALTGLEETVGDTILLQGASSVPVVDTTLLQAEIDLGLAVVTDFQGGVSPAPSPFFPKPGAPIPVTALAEVLAEPALPSDHPVELPSGFNASAGAVAPPSIMPPGHLDDLFLAASNLAEATVLQALEPEPVAGSTQLQAEVAAAEAAADPLAEALAAQGLTNEEEQQAFLAVLQAGVANVPLLAGGPSQGITATLAGAGWVHVPDATNAAEAAAIWAFHLPYRDSEVPAVTSSSKAEVAGTRTRPQHAGEPLTTYSAHGGQAAPLDAGQASTLDILD